MDLNNLINWSKTVVPIVYKKLAPGVFVIGRYQPDILDAEKIGEDLLDMTSGLAPHPRAMLKWDVSTIFDPFNFMAWYRLDVGAEVRAPESRVYEPQFQGPSVAFHRDGIPEDPLSWFGRTENRLKFN